MSLRLKQLLKEKGVTLQTLAERMGVTKGSLSCTINRNPTLSTLEKIAECLDVPITDLFESNQAKAICPHCGKPIKINIE